MIYQTPADEARQLAVARWLETKLKGKLHTFPSLNPIDWYLERDGKVAAFAELKCRFNKHDAYPTVFAAAVKVEDLINWGNGAGLPAKYVWAFTDRLGHAEADSLVKYDTEMRGRGDNRGGKNDIELMHLIPSRAITWINYDNGCPYEAPRS